jgi:hypothetical protein
MLVQMAPGRAQKSGGSCQIGEFAKTAQSVVHGSSNQSGTEDRP